MSSPAEKLKEAIAKARLWELKLDLEDRAVGRARDALSVAIQKMNKAKEEDIEFDDEDSAYEYEVAIEEFNDKSAAKRRAISEYDKVSEEKKKADEAVKEAEALVKNSPGANGANSAKGGKRRKRMRRTMRRRKTMRSK